MEYIKAKKEYIKRIKQIKQYKVFHSDFKNSKNTKEVYIINGVNRRDAKEKFLELMPNRYVSSVVNVFK